MKFKWKKEYIQIAILAFLVIAASLLFYTGIFKMGSMFEAIGGFLRILAPVLYGVVLAYILNPMVRFFESKIFLPVFERKKALSKKKKKIIRYAAVIFALGTFIYIIYALIMMILPELIRSIINIVNSFPTYVDVVQEKIIEFSERTQNLDPALADQFEQYAVTLQDFLTNNVLPEMQSILKNFSAGVFDVITFLKNFVIGAIISIYVMADKENFIAKSKMIVCALFPTNRANALIRVMRLTNRAFSGFIIGKIIDSAIIGVICYVIISLMHIPYAILISVIIGVTNIIPFFGPWLGAIPSTLLILLINPIQALYFVIFILLLQQFDGNILGPKILGGSTGLSSFMVVVAILVGGGLWGVPGMVVGVPIAAILYAIIWGFIARSLDRKELPVNESDYMYLDRIDNRTGNPIHYKDEKRSGQSSFNMNPNDDAIDYNVIEVEEIFTEMGNPEYIPPEERFKDKDELIKGTQEQESITILNFIPRTIKSILGIFEWLKKYYQPVISFFSKYFSVISKWFINQWKELKELIDKYIGKGN